METKQTILIVDDTPENIDVLAGILDPSYKLKVATSGSAALRHLEGDELPDLILLDIMMPEMSGFEVCIEIQEQLELEDIPVIFISALNEAHDRVTGLSLGGVDYITKPFHPEEVKARIKTHLKLVRQRKEFEELCKKLAESEKEREKIRHMIVHDIRSPLSDLLLSLQVLKGDLTSPDNLRAVDEALANGSSLRERISALLDIE